MSSQYFPPYESTNNIKVELDLANYATKDDVKNITHVDVSSYATKTNLAALKSEVDKIDVDELKTTPAELAKLSNVVKNDVVKKTDYNTKGTSDYNTKGASRENQIAGVTKNTLDNLADITKLKAVDTSNSVLKTKFTADVNTLETEIDTVDKKIPDVSGLATKSSLTAYLQTATFNSKVTEVENKIKTTDIIAKSAITKANTIKIDLTCYAKKADVATGIAAIKNDYITNSSLTSQLNDLKSQHIATEVTGIDNKTKKNASDILALENKLQQSYLVCNYKMGSFSLAAIRISAWKSGGIFNYVANSNMNADGDTSGNSPDLKNDGRMRVYLSGNCFKQDKTRIRNNNNAINIYCVYKLDPIASSRDTTFTIQNALFGAMQITKNADTDKYKYKGYDICFDEGGLFSIGNINNGRNVIIFGVIHLENSVIHANNKANNIFVMGDAFVQGINDTTLYAEKMYSQNFAQPSIKFVLSLHYNGDNSYLFVNGKQELKFKAQAKSLVKEKLCIGNLSDQWTTSESEKTGLYGNIYDFVVDYEAIIGVKTIYDMHSCLMIKYNISS